jgi:hypothetical protein
VNKEEKYGKFFHARHEQNNKKKYKEGTKNTGKLW